MEPDKKQEVDPSENENTQETDTEATNPDKPQPRLSPLQMVAIGVIIFAVGMMLVNWFGPKPTQPADAPPQPANLSDGPLEANAINPTGPHTWEVDGRRFTVRQTYWLEVPEGVFFIIEFNPCVPLPDDKLQGSQMFASIFPLFKHAYQKDLYKHPSPDARQPNAIGVLLIDATGDILKPYRFPLKIDDIAVQIERLKQAETRPSLLEAPKPPPLESLSPAAQELLPVLLQLIQTKAILTPEGVQTAGAHLPAMLALSDDDLEFFTGVRFIPFQVMAAQLAKDSQYQDYVIEHFDEIANWRIKLTWAVSLLMAQRTTPEALEYVKSANDETEKQTFLRQLFGNVYDEVMNSILNPTTVPAASNAESPVPSNVEVPVTLPAK